MPVLLDSNVGPPLLSDEIAVNNRVVHKQFDITIRANLDGSPGRFDVIWQIRRVEDKTNLVYSRFTSKDFDSEKVAYESGLQEARAWIDENPSLIAKQPRHP